MNNVKIIVRIRGGLGNQLYCYAAARRLAIANDAELVIDDVTGFIRDHQFKRKYALDRFSIASRKATPRERMEPLERYRRGIAKYLAKNHPFHERRYVEQEGFDFDPRLLEFHPKGTVYIDGLWQSEGYFKDAEAVIRQDLRIDPPQDDVNREMAEEIKKRNSICVHIRRYGMPKSGHCNNINQSYYSQAVKYISVRVPNPHYFIFSDAPDAAHTLLSLPTGSTTSVFHNSSAANAYADLWLMVQCKHFIIANSTFSWWGAWLGEIRSTIVMAPQMKSAGVDAWPFRGLIPDRWILVPAEL